MILQQNFSNLPKYGTLKEFLGGGATDPKAGLKTDLYKQAYSFGMSVPQFLECTVGEKHGDLTAFESLFKEFGIFTKNDLKRGILSSPATFFVPADHPQSAILFPAFIQQQAILSRLKSTMSLDRLVATTRQITAPTYQGLTIDDSGLEPGMSHRVGEGAEFPTVSITWGSFAKALKKHGVRINWSYEFLRRCSIEMVGLITQRMAMRDSINAFNDAVTWLLNGDVNDATNCPAATVTSAVSLDSTIGANDGVITYKAWLKWLSLFDTFQPDLVIGDINAVIAVMLMTRPAADTLALMSALKQSWDGTITKVTNQGAQLFPNVEFLVVPTATIGANTILGIDTSACCEKVIEVGSDLTETTKFITNQTESLVMSVTDDLSFLWPAARRVLSLDNTP